MKCEVCLKLLEEYIDSELAGREAEQVSAHLMTCVGCAKEFDGLTAEQEVYARYDRALDISPALWSAIAARTAAETEATESSSRVRFRDRIAGLFNEPAFGWSFAGVAVILLLAAVIGVAYLRNRKQPHREEVVNVGPTAVPDKRDTEKVSPPKSDIKATAANDEKLVKILAPGSHKPTLIRRKNSGAASPSDVLFPEVAYSAAEEQETQTHIEQAQNLLRSIRNIEFSEDDTEIDVTYEKALSRQLLNENVVLRRDAEMSGKFPVKTLLASLEPFLLDIANLPDKTSPDDLREIRDRVQKTEIVAALHTY